MAIYHLSVKIGGRSKGQSAVAAAAYRSGDILLDEEIGKEFDYTKKGGIVFSEISICKEAPAEYSDREVLWNAVHKVEKAKNARLWREIEVALPKELSRNDQIKVVRNFVSQLVDKGMCADWSLHDKKDGNPHAHIMLTTRSIKPDGTWAPKCRKEYILDDNNERIALEKKDSKGRTQYKSYKVDYNNWNDKERVEEWRALWADQCNKLLNPSYRIDHRSYKRQKIDKIPTIHEGYVARKRSRNNMESDRVNLNKEIKFINSCGYKIPRFERIVKSLDDEIEKLGKEIIANSQQADEANMAIDKQEIPVKQQEVKGQKSENRAEQDHYEEYEFSHKSKKTDDAKSEVTDPDPIQNDTETQNLGSEVSTVTSVDAQLKMIEDEEKEALEKQKEQKHQQKKTEQPMSANKAAASEQLCNNTNPNTAVPNQTQKVVSPVNESDINVNRKEREFYERLKKLYGASGFYDKGSGVENTDDGTRDIESQIAEAEAFRRAERSEIAKSRAFRRDSELSRRNNPTERDHISDRNGQTAYSGSAGSGKKEILGKGQDHTGTGRDNSGKGQDNKELDFNARSEGSRDIDAQIAEARTFRQTEESSIDQSEYIREKQQVDRQKFSSERIDSDARSSAERKAASEGNSNNEGSIQTDTVRITGSGKTGAAETKQDYGYFGKNNYISVNNAGNLFKDDQTEEYDGPDF